MLLVAGLLTLSQGWLALAENIETLNDDSSQYACGENVGRLNAESLSNCRPGAEIDELYAHRL